MEVSFLREPKWTEHLQKCPYMIVHRLQHTEDDPYYSFSCVWYTWNKVKPTPSFCCAQPNFFLCRFIFSTLQALVADSHRIQNQVESISLLNSVHTLVQSPTFSLLGMSASLYIFSFSKPEHPTLLVLTLWRPMQSLVRFLPNEKCIQQSSF